MIADERVTVFPRALPLDDRPKTAIVLEDVVNIEIDRTLHEEMGLDERIARLGLVKVLSEALAEGVLPLDHLELRELVARHRLEVLGEVPGAKANVALASASIDDYFGTAADALAEAQRFLDEAALLEEIEVASICWWRARRADAHGVAAEEVSP